LKILRLDQPINVEDLKTISHLALKELKVVLFEIAKKSSFMDSWAGLTSSFGSSFSNNAIGGVAKFV